MTSYAFSSEVFAPRDIWDFYLLLRGNYELYREKNVVDGAKH